MFKPLSTAPFNYSVGLMWHRGRFQRLRGTNGDYWRWSGNQFGQPAKVLGDGCQRELVLGAARATKPKATKLQDALEMGEQHLDAFAITA